jgi:hypothetical protein
MKKSEIASIVAVLLEAFPNAKLGERTRDVYEDNLQDLEAASVGRAVQRLIGTCRFLPTIAEIREAATDLHLGPRRTGAEGWQDAILEVRRIGWCGSPKFRDPLVAQCIQMWGSWQSFCNSPEDDPGGRARFIELYETLSKRDRSDVQTGVPLPAAGGLRRLT